VAEEEGGGGHGSIKLPVIGGANKKVVLIVGGTAAAYVLWRYWQSSQASGDVVAGDSDGDGYADAGTLPSVAGAVREDNGYGLPDGGSTGGSTDAYGFTGTTNSQWTQYAATQLSAASDKWSYGDVLDALGQFIANRPLTSAQQQIVQAAIAAAGQPPEGTHPVISGGDTPITVAPGHVRTWDVTTDTQVCFQWDAVAGASHYRIYRSGQGDEPVGDSADTKFRAKGLTPNKSYTFQVAAVSASGKVGPKSSAYTAKTKAVVLAKPSTPRVTLVSKTTAHVSTGAVKGATGYNWYVNGTARGHSDGPAYTLSGLKAGTSYKVHVKADTSNQGPGPASPDATFKTKK
jgi:hypothetical protein